MAGSIVFIDSELSVSEKKVMDLGAVKEDGAQFHSPSIRDFSAFIAGSAFLCGHNIVRHDLFYLRPLLDAPLSARAIDTLYLSPLLFPERPYHALLKDDKLQTDELNNPLNDAEKARKLFYDEVNAFSELSVRRKEIYYGLLNPYEEFQGFFAFMKYKPLFSAPERAIRREFSGMICEHADLRALAATWPVELAYALALIGCGDYHSVTPPWLMKNYPGIEYVMKALRGRPCQAGCPYCREAFGLHRKLKEFFGFSRFRSYGGEPLQERAVRAAVEGKSLLAVFPTGGGKSVTFQLPALMAGQTEHGLTVVISPLQSLMKDQVDNLSEHGLVDAVTVNGLLSPVERAEALERVANGLATIFYISPEQLRSRTIEKLLLSRTRRSRQLAEKLTSDGFPARPYNGKMDPADKIANQDAFIRGEVNIIVATSAFGMGVDKKDVGLVVHYDISDSLENYIQEAGRAGRDSSITAECFVLFQDNDLDKHFILLNQTKLSISEIQQVWKAMKDLTRNRATVCCSPLEIARQAGYSNTKYFFVLFKKYTGKTPAQFRSELPAAEGQG